MQHKINTLSWHYIRIHFELYISPIIFYKPQCIIYNYIYYNTKYSPLSYIQHYKAIVLLNKCLVLHSQDWLSQLFGQFHQHSLKLQIFYQRQQFLQLQLEASDLCAKKKIYSHTLNRHWKKAKRRFEPLHFAVKIPHLPN